MSEKIPDSRVEIDVTATGRGTVKVNGIDLSNIVTELSLSARAGELTEVHLVIMPTRLKVTGAAHVETEYTGLRVEDGYIPVSDEELN